MTTSQPTAPKSLPRCGARCWFAYYGIVGSSAPTCRRCGRDNPHYRPTDDPFRARETTKESVQ